MYSDKRNVNILTSLLVSHGIKHVVVCPGSRNAPLVHNFNECPQLICHPVTDERSAGFFALGIAQATDAPVAICVTSGTAILNVSPAVAEASYQHHGLIVISADRPQAWIDQLDGQTMPQQNVLGKFVSKSVCLPEVDCEESRWYCNRLVNEALIAVRTNCGKSVHINIPISEPLFNFTTDALPVERKIDYITTRSNITEREIETFIKARRPLIVLGQMKHEKRLTDIIREIRKRYVVLCEPLSQGNGATWFDEMFETVNGNASFAPDYILYIGDTIVSKLLKKYLRSLDKIGVSMVSIDGEVHDVTMSMDRLIVCNAIDILSTLANYSVQNNIDNLFLERWNMEIEQFRNGFLSISSDNLLKETVRLFETKIGKCADTSYIHYANSTPVRYGCLYSRHYIYVNRGINGIEGSLSTAAGFSSVTTNNTFIVIGDLSFFYDVNALWNNNIGGNLRIILLNNGGGGIFSNLKGLENSPALDKYIAACHNTSAEGICKSYGVEYHSALTLEDVEKALSVIINNDSDIPILLEVKCNK